MGALSGFFEPPNGQSQVLLHSVLPHHSPHHATLIGVMGYEVQIGMQTLAFPTLAGQNPKSYFTPNWGIKGDRLGDRSERSPFGRFAPTNPTLFLLFGK